MALCRACLCTSDNLAEVDATFLFNYNSLTNLLVEPLDGLPNRFCCNCIEAVNFFMKFREKCISSESFLRKKSPDCKHPESPHLDIEVEQEIEIKNEIKEETTDPFVYELKDHSIKVEVEVEKKQNVTGNSSEVESKPNEEEKKVCQVEVRRRGRKRKLKRGRKPLLHVTVNNPKPTYTICEGHYCGLCDESFIVLELLHKHLDTHRTDKKCGICSAEFENWPQLLAHRVLHTGKKYCHLCAKRFYISKNLENHYLNFHYEQKVAEMTCSHCPKKFTCPEKFSIHEETHIIECDSCPAIFTTRRLLNAHLRTHIPKKRYQCDMCEYTAVYAEVLDKHKKRKHKTLLCEVCDRKFADPARLKRHVCKDKSKICPICGQRIYESLNRHMVSHTDAKPYKCDRCPATYKNPVSLKTHTNRHIGNRPFVCDYCDRRFFAGSTLSKHRRVHTGEKPYACDKCGKRFTGNSNLRMHMKVHGIMLINKRAKPEEAPAGPLPGPSAQATSEETVKK